MAEERVTLDDSSRSEAIVAIKRYFEEERDESVGDLAAGLILDFFLERVGPAIYNQGLDDAQAWFERRMQDVEADYRSLRKDVGR